MRVPGPRTTTARIGKTAMNRPSDPLWELRHPLASLSLAGFASIFIAAFAGRWLGDLFGDSYEVRAAIYLVLLVYAVAGGVVMFMRIDRYPLRRLSVGYVLLWLGRIWLWPALLTLRRGRDASQ